MQDIKLQSKSVESGLCDCSKLYGTVTYKAYDKDGNLVDTKTTHNNIVLGIRAPIIRLLAGYKAGENDSTAPTIAQSLPFVRSIRLGTDGTTPTVSDTTLKSEIEGSYKEMTSDPTVNIPTDGSAPSVTFSFMYPASTPTIEAETIREMGLFTKDHIMIARTAVGEWKKVSGLYFEIYWTIGYSSSANS